MYTVPSSTFPGVPRGRARETPQTPFRGVSTRRCRHHPGCRLRADWVPTHARAAAHRAERPRALATMTNGDVEQGTMKKAPSLLDLQEKVRARATAGGRSSVDAMVKGFDRRDRRDRRDDDDGDDDGDDVREERND